MGQPFRGPWDPAELISQSKDDGHIDEVEQVTQTLRELGFGVESRPEDPIAWQLLGHYLEEMGEENRARHCYTVAARELVKRPRPDDIAELEVKPLPFAVLVDRPGTLDN